MQRQHIMSILKYNLIGKARVCCDLIRGNGPLGGRYCWHRIKSHHGSLCRTSLMPELTGTVKNTTPMGFLFLLFEKLYGDKRYRLD